MGENSMLKAALAYANKGWSVFPVPPNSKKSYVAGKKRGGVRWGATRDAAEITRLWKKWPNANIGLPTGENFFVLEIDTPKGHNVDGAASLRALETKHTPLPTTLTAQSPSGSTHFYFQMPANETAKVWNSAGTIAPGCDLRGTAGMVVAPPSMRKDGEYVWINTAPITQAPKWLLGLVTARIRQNAPATGSEVPNAFTQYGENVTKTKVDAGDVLDHMASGNVHASQVRATATLLNDGVDRDVVIDRVLSDTQDLPNTAGWDWEEERSKIAGMCDTWLDRLKGEHKAAAAAEEAEVGEMSSGVFQFGQVYPADDWLYGHHIMRGEVAGSAAPGGVGKSTLAIVEALAMASGKDLVGQGVQEPIGVLLINLEDNIGRMGKRIEAAMRKYELKPDDLGGRLKVWAKGEVNFVIAKPTKNPGEVKRQDVLFNKLLDYIQTNNISVVSVDPFVRTHQIAENDNVAIAKVVTFFEQVAQQGGCGISLWHHTRKMSGDGASPTVDSARGASSFVDACRSVRVLETMTEKQAEELDIELERRRVFSCYSGKLNYAPPIEESEWYRIDSVHLTDPPYAINAETVGVVEHFTLPVAKDLTPEQIKAIKAAVDGEPRWRHWRGRGPIPNMWVGDTIAPIVNTEKTKKLQGIITALLNKKILRTLEWKDSKSHKKDATAQFVVVVDGQWKPPQ